MVVVIPNVANVSPVAADFVAFRVVGLLESIFILSAIAV
jgi:hypothetical protein